MSAIVIIIPTAIATRLGEDDGLREQYIRECEALDRAMREPPPRTRPIALPRRTGR
jgi:hypothetical protein